MPEKVLPTTVSALLGSAGPHEVKENEDASDEDESVVTSKFESAKELQGLYGAFAAQQEAAGAEEDRLQPVGDEAAGRLQPLRVGTTFLSMEVAAHMVRLQSPIRMLVVPGTSKKCKVWCCHSNKCAHKADGVRGAPSDDGSRAMSHQSGGCAALFQVHGCEHESDSYMPALQPPHPHSPLTLIQPSPSFRCKKSPYNSSGKALGTAPLSPSKSMVLRIMSGMM